MNENSYTITLTRLEICDLMLACTSVKWDAIREMQDDVNCPDYRRKVVLPQTVKKWEALHDKVKAQLLQNDCGRVFSDLVGKYGDSDITKDELLREFGLWAETLK